jgi:hypothetical protein
MMNPYTYSNSEWVISTQVQTTTDDVISEIRFSVILSRKPVFLMTNIVFPVMIITIVNGYPMNGNVDKVLKLFQRQ